jgi:mannosylglycoprotein endo-beta-mannosidase
VNAQVVSELNSSWHCIKATQLRVSGSVLSKPGYKLTGWMPAVVPGTVLTTLIHNKLVPDPFYGMNNKQIPDIYTAGRNQYTYWFVNDFPVRKNEDGAVYINFRGINYGCDVFVNGHKLNKKRLEGMYLRRQFNITPFVTYNQKNRVAVIVYPPDPVGKPNGGQGGDGTIARNLTNQYVAGWDWVQAVPDRNTGIWDKVTIVQTGGVKMANTHVVTHVPGKREPDNGQAPAVISVSTELENTSPYYKVKGKLIYNLEGRELSVPVQIGAGERVWYSFPNLTLPSPRLWWPNGYGRPELYKLTVKFLIDDKVESDEETVSFGIRELSTLWNTNTQSRELYVNGQKIFIKGGNRILSDELLRFSAPRYDDEVRYHRDMNLNLIRVWGGGITERPEFYDACDKYGLLVMQDFWMSGDCNGRWDDPLKLDDTTTRRKYPDDHRLFIDACADQVLMLRNHPSLALWCGGNEIRPPADILHAMRDSILPALDGTRYFFEYSNDDSMSLDAHDGPYTIQDDSYFWKHRSWGFNSEIGSVGVGDLESMEQFIPAKNLVVPYYDALQGKWVADSVWRYHKYCSYDSSVEKYGHPKDIADFARKAQLVNYNQYRSLMESFVSKMWDWYTGAIIWKTQNPWTAMVGQMYDVFLDPNASLYGLAEGAKPTHVYYNPVDHTLAITNTDRGITQLTLDITGLDINGKQLMSYTEHIPVDSVLKGKPFVCHDFKGKLLNLGGDSGLFLHLNLEYKIKGTDKVDENLYWLPDRFGNYSGITTMSKANVGISATSVSTGHIVVHITNAAANPIAFFNRLSLVDNKTKKRILPVFCNNNYISVLPGTGQTITIEYRPQSGIVPVVCIEGWNVDKQYIVVKNLNK